MLILPTLLKAVGSGIGLLGQLGSANSAESMADLNYQLGAFNARQQRDATLTGLKLERAGIRSQLSAARSNMRLALLDAEAREKNAERLRLFAEARTKQGREAIRRQRRSFQEFEGRQRAAVAASGVTMSGSPLEVMAESAAQMKLALSDMADEIGFERSNTLAQAAMESFGARQERSAARLGFGYAKRGTALALAGNRIAGNQARTSFRSNMLGAEFARLSGYDQAAGQRLSAVGSLFTGAAGYLSDRDRINYLGMT